MGIRGFALEAAADIIELTDALGWPRFVIVGHSMSSLVAIHLAQHCSDRVSHAIVITPPPPTGFGADAAGLAAARALALGDDAARHAALTPGSPGDCHRVGFRTRLRGGGRPRTKKQ